MKRTPLARKTPLRAKTPIKSAGSLRRTPMKAARPATSKIRQSAKGQACKVRVPGICDGGGETTVLAHLNGAGMGMKADDIHGADCCGPCHAWLDGGYAKTHTREQRDLYHLQGVIRTQRRLIDEGLMAVAS